MNAGGGDGAVFWAAASWVAPALALGLSLLVGWASVPAWRAWFVRRGWVDDPGPRKPHHGSIPLAGGLALLSGWLVAVVAGRGLGDSGAPPSGDHLWVMLIGATMMGLLGWWDDVRELSPAPKLFGQVAILAGTVAAGVRLPWLQDQPWAQAALTLVFLLAGLNAVNFLDNMNGLCAGLGAVGAGTLAALAALDGRRDLCLAAVALAAGCVGVLPWNFPRARVFLGDTGSHVVGYLLSVLALEVAMGRSVPGAAGWVAPLLALAVPAMDFAQVTVRRAWRRQPLWTGDTTHLSHELARRGLGSVGAVVVLWAVAGLAGSGAIALRWWAAQ